MSIKNEWFFCVTNRPACPTTTECLGMPTEARTVSRFGFARNESRSIPQNSTRPFGLCSQSEPNSEEPADALHAKAPVANERTRKREIWFLWLANIELSDCFPEIAKWL